MSKQPLKWTDVTKTVMQMTEKEAQDALKHEMATAGRLKLMLRLYSRFSKLRSAREKAELGKVAKA